MHYAVMHTVGHPKTFDISCRVMPSWCCAKAFTTLIYRSALLKSTLQSSSNSPLIMLPRAKNGGGAEERKC